MSLNRFTMKIYFIINLTVFIQYHKCQFFYSWLNLKLLTPQKLKIISF
jgi:hypothetical protein